MGSVLCCAGGSFWARGTAAATMAQVVVAVAATAAYDVFWQYATYYGKEVMNKHYG